MNQNNGNDIEIKIGENDQHKDELANRLKQRLEKDKKDELGDVVFHATDPRLKYNAWWTVLMVTLITVALGVIVFLVVKGAPNTSVVKEQERLAGFNQVKVKYDQALVAATNELVKAENSFNNGNFSEANDTSKIAEDDFNQLIDYAYELGGVDLGDQNQAFKSYFANLEEAAKLGEKMSKSLAYASRSADRGQEVEAKKSLSEYDGYAQDLELVIKKVQAFKNSQGEFFKANT
ncbi:MAG: hypothetical protein ACOZAR_05215 [Patescibacteria group bacterium]